MPYQMYSPGAAQMLRAMFGPQGMAGVYGQNGPMSYAAERKNNQAIQYGSQLLRGTGNPQGTTSGAVRDAGEKVAGALLSGFLGKKYNDQEKTANDQWTNIIGGGDGLEGMQQRAQGYGANLDPKVASQLGNMTMISAMDKPNQDFQREQWEEGKRQFNANYALKQQEIAATNALRQASLGAQMQGTWTAIPGGMMNSRTGEIRMLPDGMGKPVPQNAFTRTAEQNAAKDYTKMQDAAGKASENNASLDRAQRAVDSGIYTGVGGDMVQQARRIGGALGLVDPNTVAGAEELQRIQNEQALFARNPASGMGLPGSASDRDVRFLQSMAAGLDKSPEANRRMLDAQRRLNQRKIEVANAANDYVAQHGKLDNGFYQQVRAYADANPLFGDMPGYESIPSTQDAMTQPSGARPPLSSF